MACYRHRAHAVWFGVCQARIGWSVAVIAAKSKQNFKGLTFSTVGAGFKSFNYESIIIIIIIILKQV